MATRKWSSRSYLVKGEAGQATVEFALTLWIWLCLILGIVDLGRGFYAYNMVANAAREGARHGIVSSITSTAIVTYATSKASTLGNVTASVVQRGTSGNPSDPVVVQVTYNFQPITPLIAQICCAGGTLTVTGRSSMYVEQ